MFSEQFTSRQKAVFLNLLEQLILADSVIETHEKMKFEEFQKLFPGIQAELVTAEDLHDIFSSRKDSIAVMLELLSVALIEGSMNTKDQIFLEKICASLGLSQNDMGWMQMWVKSMLFLIAQVGSFQEA